MNWKSLLFSFRGRVNRAKYWLAVLIPLIAWVITGVMIAMTFAVNGPYGESIVSTIAVLVGAVIVIATIWSGLAVGIKRLHDRNKSGWWLLLFFLVPALLDAVGKEMGGVGAMVAQLLAVAIGIWMFVELGCLRGTSGPNKFGPDPLNQDAFANQPAV